MSRSKPLTEIPSQEKSVFLKALIDLKAEVAALRAVEETNKELSIHLIDELDDIKKRFSSEEK